MKPDSTYLNAATGKPAWHFNVGQKISSSPMSYRYLGKQYIALTAASDVFSFGLLE